MVTRVNLRSGTWRTLFWATLLVVGGTWFAQAASADPMAPLRYLPVQDAGRNKPFDTFARESLQLVYGSQEYTSPKGIRHSAIEIVMTWMLVPQHWDNQKIIQIPHRGLKTALDVDLDSKYFSPVELFASNRLAKVMQDLAGSRATKEKLNPYLQAVQRLENQLGVYQAIKQGTAIRLVPPPKAAVTSQTASALGGGLEGGPPRNESRNEPQTQSEPQKWLAVADLQGEFRERFNLLTRSFIQALPKGEDTSSLLPIDPSVPPLDKAVNDFIAAARAENPELYPAERDISLEVHYKEFHPFQISWIIYLVSAVLLAVAWQTGSKKVYAAAWTASIAAFLLHTYGFGLRIYLTGRPPVSNMYESVVWVSWGSVVFGFILEAIYRRRFILLAGNVVSVLCLIVADMAPTVLDSSIQPLEPVLRSNYWLTVHVLTITLSYSAFFLAWGLANIGLWFFLRGEKATSERAREMTQSIYRSIQVGVVLLAAGIILGGIWADYSWGRFWGWDPKETWALIALLGYLAMLHGRLVGMLQNFGMMVASIVSFNLVIMAWYGVNYVLGAGLHSYGFGAGGVQYVGAFVVLNLVYVGYVAYVRASQRAIVDTAVK